MDKSSQSQDYIPDFLTGSGEMGRLIGDYDWSKTPLDPIDKWTQSLRTTVGLVLAQRFPMLLWWGPDYISIYNDAYIPVLGDKHPWGLGKPVKECWGEVWDVIQPLIDSPFYGGPSTWIEDFQLLLNRNKFWEEAHFTVAYSPVPDETTSNRIGGVLATVHEITEKVIHERALSTLRQLGAVAFEETSLDLVYKNVADVLQKNPKDFPFALVYKISGDKNILAIAASTGIKEREHVFPHVIDTENPTTVTKEFCEAFTENKIVDGKINIESGNLPTGAWETAPVQFVHIPVSVAGASHPHCIISAALNPYRKFDDTYKEFCQLISDRVSLEINKMLALEEEKKRAKSLAEIDKAKTTFFSNVSHEFRTPLTLILGTLEEMLKDHKREAVDREAVETTHRNALRLLRLVNNLLDFSRIEAGKARARFQLTDIAKYTTELASNFRTILSTAGLTFNIKTNTVIQPVYIDREMWEKIVLNLLSNAFKYTLEGSIELSLTTENNQVLLQVSDTGVGIPEKELPKIFQRFHRVQNTTARSHEGTGIGLSLVKELVNLHGGNITVASKMGKGTEFMVTIPTGKKHLPIESIVEKDSDFNKLMSEAFIEEATSLIGQRGSSNGHEQQRADEKAPNILLVDDNADMRAYLKSLLQKKIQCGYGK